MASIGAGAFRNCKNLKSVVIGKGVKGIPARAFGGCKALKRITIKSGKLKKAGRNAFKGIHAKAVIKVPKAKLKAYKKLLKNKGQGKKKYGSLHNRRETGKTHYFHSGGNELFFCPDYGKIEKYYSYFYQSAMVA